MVSKTTGSQKNATLVKKRCQNRICEKEKKERKKKRVSLYTKLDFTSVRFLTSLPFLPVPCSVLLTSVGHCINLLFMCLNICSNCSAVWRTVL